MGMRKRQPRPRPRGSATRRMPRDVAATRARLLEAGRDLFAERGYDDVTVRDICREAGANVALVNYYFGDKEGLYHEVINQAIASVRGFNELALNAPNGSSAEHRLRHFVRVLMQRVFEQRGDASGTSWVHKLIQHEINRPTAAAQRILDEAIAPRLRYLAVVVQELLACPLNDPRVMQCVASVHGLCLVYSRMVIAPERFRALAPDLVPAGDLTIEAAAEHVSTFSLAGIAAMRGR